MSNIDPAPAPAQETKTNRLSKRLPTFRVGFGKQMDALRAYAVLSDGGAKSVHYSRVADIIKVHEANVSSANPFFLENGFLEKSGNGYMPSPHVLEYNRQFQWNPETAAQKLRPIVANSWFGQALIQRLQFRSMSEDEAIEALAAECSAGPESKPALRTLIEYADAAGVLARANGQLSAVSMPSPQKSEEAKRTSEPSTSTTPHTPESKIPTVSQRRAEADPGSVNFQVSVDVSLAEMKDWTPDRITAFFGGIAQVLTAKNG